MRRLIGKTWARLRADERGSYAVTVAVLFAALLAVMALTIDTGMLYEERHELQNAADAGALAVAFDCARGACDPGAADLLADPNATTDGSAGVESVDIDMGAAEVTVVTRSEADDGTDSLYLAAAQVFGVESVTVRASATAAWDALGSQATVPYVISFCDIDQALDDQGGYVELPPPSGFGAVITFHDPDEDEEESCDGYPGFDQDGDGVLPGGFGMLDVEEDCTVQTYTDENDDVWAPAKPGTGVPAPWQCLALDTVLTIPVFVDFRTTPKEYRIGGYASFYVTGWRISGYSNPGPEPCGPPADCISGWFTEDTVIDGGTGGIDFGTRTARLTR